MVRTATKKSDKDEKPEPDADTEERKRLKNLSFSKKLLSRNPSKPISPLNPSKIIIKHQGRDVVKKGQRKNRFLFSFPGLLAPVTGGKIGELKGLGTKNPILYLDFPQGRVKLFGTIVYPKNKYLTLQFGRGSKNVMCEDSFENMIVFSEAWWIGRKDENPDEVQLEFPKELNEGKHGDYDFKGGAGVASEEGSGVNKPRREYVEPLSPESELKDDVSEDSGLLNGKNLNDATEVTPVRQSARTAGKTYKYAESSGDYSVGSDEKEVNDEVDCVARGSLLEKTKDSSIAVSTPHASENEDDEMKTILAGKIKQSSLVKKYKEISLRKQGALKQATISTLFEKVEEKKSTRSVKKSPAPKDSLQNIQPTSPKRRTKQAKDLGPVKKEIQFKGKKTGRATPTKRKHAQVEDDDIEDISSDSQDINGSDEDWAA
ncbi:root hair initiation protein root hairless 1 (RHL1) [Tasmannia lanceolata]|uniref:root hair initiation protein root hairless 1 (RHL1) n=1 Tax=Tasmannia lanceolata TaxID=3420 RepID=UPI004064320D